MGLVSKIFGSSTAKSAVEGQYRPGPWMTLDGWLPQSWGSKWNYWQHGYDPISGLGNSAIVEACVSRYAQTVAMCPGSHWRTNTNGGRERIVASSLNRILRRPNAYQSISDFLLNGVRSIYLEGNWYALALRNDRFEIDSLHLMNPRHCGVSAIGDDGSVFYKLGGNQLIERQGYDLTAVPSRDVLHVRLHTPRDHLKGETPLASAAVDIATGNTIAAQQLAFYNNQARPSYILGTDQVLTKDQTLQLRELWDEQSKGMNSGGVPIMAGGLKPLPLTISAQDMQLIEVLKLSEQHIALAYGVPLQVLGIGGSTYSSTEALMNSWLASGLGFALNHIEEAIGNLFGLKGQPEEYLEFDTEALLRSSFKERMEGLNSGVQGGVLAPNEARRKEGYPDAKDGDEPRVQQQVVPLSAWSQTTPQTPAPPAADPAPAAPAEPSEPTPAEDRANADTILRAFREAHRNAA